MKLAIFLGSESDFDVVKDALGVLREFKVPFELEITSAHRSPERTVKLLKSFEKKGVEIFIAVAGKAAHLAGVVAAHTTRPVIGVPVEGATLNGLDALLSTVQMPRGVPVACMGLGKSGALNAVLLAIQILGLKDISLAVKMKEYREKMARKVDLSSRKIREKM
ncbi:MAG: 5-(carboxyamino)imidazole ribonucleotide mutase [Acidobacteriota bacterium]|nr:5-(carboxyamino)imidazole ribonucleotide mutase [Acidobacteriota bacterium]